MNTRQWEVLPRGFLSPTRVVFRTSLSPAVSRRRTLLTAGPERFCTSPPRPPVSPWPTPSRWEVA